jgi:hypothetical protein
MGGNTDRASATAPIARASVGARVSLGVLACARPQFAY